MYSLIVYVAPSVEVGANVVDAWQKAGVPNFTVLESSGLRAHQRWLNRDDVPLMPGLRHLVSGPSKTHRTVFTVVEKSLVDGVIKATETVVGDLTAPDTGLLFEVSVERALATTGMIGRLIEDGHGDS